jgi:hypothetical protein
MPRDKEIHRPHFGVFTRIRPSKIHRGGVGVFAIVRIKKGTYIFPDDTARICRVKKGSLRGLSSELRRLYEDFAVVKGDYYLCPLSFNRLTVSWYINEPKKGQSPNVGCDRTDYTFYALRNIKAGEELTTDYSTYSEPPNRRKLKGR